jgi:hypothetical protein
MAFRSYIIMKGVILVQDGIIITLLFKRRGKKDELPPAI